LEKGCRRPAKLFSISIARTNGERAALRPGGVAGLERARRDSLCGCAADFAAGSAGVVEDESGGRFEQRLASKEVKVEHSIRPDEDGVLSIAAGKKQDLKTNNGEAAARLRGGLGNRRGGNPLCVPSGAEVYQKEARCGITAISAI